MSSINTILNNGLSGLQVNELALRITADNISNVNTDGYVRKIVQMQNRLAGSQSVGVEIAGVQRVVDQFLQRASLTSSADSNRYQVISDMENRLQTLFGSPSDNTSFSGKIDAVFSAISDASLNPSTTALRQAVLAAITDFGSEAGRISGQVQDLRQEASDRISSDVTTINLALEHISKLNTQIIRQKQLGGDASALEESRQNSISQISNLMDVSVENISDGSVRVTSGSGLSLVDGSTLYRLSYDSPGTVDSDTQFPSIQITRVDPLTGNLTGSAKNLDSSLRSGEIKGLMDMRDTVLPDLANQIGELSAQFIDGVNAVHNAGTSYPPPNSLVGRDTGLLSTDLQGFSGQAEFAVTDSSGTQINSVTVDFGTLPAGSTIADVVNQVNTALGGDATMSFTNGVMSFTGAGDNRVAIGQIAGSESSRGGHGFSQFFGMNDLVTSQVPSNFDTGFQSTDASSFTPGGTINLQLVGPDGTVVNSGTVTMAGGSFGATISDMNAAMSGTVTFSLDANGALVSTPSPAYSGYSIRVVSDSTSRGPSGTSLSELFGLGNSFTANAAKDIQVSDAVSSDQSKLALGELTTGGAAGDSVLTASDNRGALALAGVANKPIKFADFGGLKSITGTLSEFGATILSDVGNRAAQAEQLAQDNSSLLQEIQQRQSDESGVNLDEELSKMIVYQNAYAAAGRVIKVAQEVYDTLLQAVS